MTPPQTATPDDAFLAEQMAKLKADPLGFVYFAYPWGVAGTELANQIGPDENQKRFLLDLGEEVKKRAFNGVDSVLPILMTATSGHGTGKSVMGAWIGDWILSTRPDSQGTATAGTWTQLETRTWAALRRWTKLCITGHWFDIQARGIFHKLRHETWRITAQSCKEQNAQSFAGQHASTSTSWYMFDEASLIPDGVWTVANGGLTDGEPMWFAWGQPERRKGRFFEINSGKGEHRWNHRRIDSRTSRFANKELMAQWLEDYGEDSDFWRVRILGLFPQADELQFIDRTRIEAAQQRKVTIFADEPLIAGFDASGGGSAWNVVRFRRGLDGRPGPTIPEPIRVPGEHSRDREALLTKLASVMKDERPGRKVAALFVDSAYGAPYVERLHVLGYANVIEINFGSSSPDRHQANMRAFMWNAAKEWLPHGAIDPKDEKLASDLSGPGAEIRVRDGKLVIESKAEMQRRGQASPDDGDAFVLTFAQPVAPPEAVDPDDDEAEFAHLRNFGGRQGQWMR
jgi:hypothetical protein